MIEEPGQSWDVIHCTWLRWVVRLDFAGALSCRPILERFWATAGAWAGGTGGDTPVPHPIRLLAAFGSGPCLGASDSWPCMCSSWAVKCQRYRQVRCLHTACIENRTFGVRYASSCNSWFPDAGRSAQKAGSSYSLPNAGSSILGYASIHLPASLSPGTIAYSTPRLAGHSSRTQDTAPLSGYSRGWKRSTTPTGSVM